MPRYDENSAQCLVYTFKDGLLSKVAHDLKIAVTRFDVEIEGDSIRAEFDTRSLKVLTPMKEGQENPSALNDADKAKIAEQIQSDVLHSDNYPTATFVSRQVTPRADGGFDVTGELTLHGTTKTITTATKSENGQQIASVSLHQPDFGITPFKAMMGTLKIKPDVIVTLSVPRG